MAEDIKMATIKGILKKNLYHTPLEEEPVQTTGMEVSMPNFAV